MYRKLMSKIFDFTIQTHKYLIQINGYPMLGITFLSPQGVFIIITDLNQSRLKIYWVLMLLYLIFEKRMTLNFLKKINQGNRGHMVNTVLTKREFFSLFLTITEYIYLTTERNMNNSILKAVLIF